MIEDYEDITVFGIRFFEGGYKKALQESLIKRNSYACFFNSHMLYEHRNNKNFEGVIKNAMFVFPDGMPFVYSLRLFRGIKSQRIAGNDFVFDLVNEAIKKKLRIFWIGSSEEVLDIISKKMALLSVKHKTYSPPYLPIHDFDFDFQADLINAYKPDMVLVGLGCPKQEIWMYKMKDRIEAPMYGLGGAFRLYAGLDSRAAKWIRQTNLEWTYRLMLEPRRLFRRYLISNSFFLAIFIKELYFKLRRMS